MILVITGNGKGKTTSAIGTAIRAAGWGMKVAIVFFDKGGDHYGEQAILDDLKAKIDAFRFGLPRFDEASKTFRFENTDADKDMAVKALVKTRELFSQGYFMIICDEILNCVRLGLLQESIFRDFIAKCPKETHLVLTGRNVPGWLSEEADLVSEVNEVKHYFKKKMDAIKGLDY